jgi:8-oxo-dGTP diphosphatase
MMPYGMAERCVCPGQPRCGCLGTPQARPAAHAPDRCARCGGRLAPRIADDPARFAERLHRFRGHIGAIRATTHLLGLPYMSIDATDDPSACLAQAKAAACRPIPCPTPSEGAPGMATVSLPTPTIGRSAPAPRADGDPYGHARLPANAHDATPSRVDRIEYGRFRNLYVYVTNRCQLRCKHCYMEERLETAEKMPYRQVMDVLHTGWGDGCWHLPSGHGEHREPATEALVREAAEELGVQLDPAEMRFAHLEHHWTESSRVAIFFEVTNWTGEPTNTEPDKCAGWQWFRLSDLPSPMIGYATQALAHYRKGLPYSERGWQE